MSMAVLVRKESERNTLVLFLTGISAFFILWGDLEVFAGVHFRSADLSGQWRVACGFLKNQNDMSTFLALFSPLFLISLITRREPYWKVPSLFLFLNGFLLIYMNSSRINIAGFLLQIVVFVYLMNKRAVIYALLAGAVLLTLVDITGIYDVFGKIFGFIRAYTNDNSFITRFNMGLNSILLTADRLSIGVGAGNMEHYIADYTVLYVEHRITSPHNFWAELLGEYGIILFTGFLWIYGNILVTLYRSVTADRKNITAAVIFTIMLGFSIHVLSSSSIFAQKHIWILFGLAAVMWSSEKEKIKTKSVF